MNWEVEQKFRVKDLVAVRAKLVELGVRLQTEEHTDFYLNHPARDFAVTDEALRVRRRDAAIEITYKGARIDRDTKTRPELELDFVGESTTADSLLELFTVLGFTQMPAVIKTRESGHVDWQGGPVTVALDQVRGLGAFVELEVIAAEEEVPAAQLSIAALAARLALTDSERRSYLELILASGP